MVGILYLYFWSIISQSHVFNNLGSMGHLHIIVAYNIIMFDFLIYFLSQNCYLAVLHNGSDHHLRICKS